MSDLFLETGTVPCSSEQLQVDVIVDLKDWLHLAFDKEKEINLPLRTTLRRRPGRCVSLGSLKILTNEASSYSTCRFLLIYLHGLDDPRYLASCRSATHNANK